MDIKIIVKDILLLELCEKKAQHIFLVNEEQVYEHCINLFLVSKIDLQRIQSYSICQYHQSLINNNFSFEKVIQEKYPIMFECLRLGNGILSICGILEEIVDTQQYNDICEHNITIYFHSCTIIEATILLEKCLLLFGNINFYLYNNNVCVYENNTAIIFCTTICNSLQELLINREHILEKQLWNPKDGYVTTLATSICIGIMAIPLNINFPCTNTSYYYRKGFSIILGGGNTIQDSRKYGGCIELPDCIILLRPQLPAINNKTNIYPFNPLIIPKNISKTIDKVSKSSSEIMSECNLTCYQPIPKVYFHPNKYFGEDYKSCTVGIDDNRYVAFANSMRAYNLPKELFRLLCCYWLIAETKLIKDRLTSLGDITSPF